MKKPLRGPDGPFSGGGMLPSGLPQKHERVGLSYEQMKDAEKIAAHPEIVKWVNGESLYGLM